MATEGLDLEETLFVVNSKTFTTAETLMNACTVRERLLKHYKESFTEEPVENIIRSHFAACSTNLDATQ
jgi:glucose-6-phosphate isomerase